MITSENRLLVEKKSDVNNLCLVLGVHCSTFSGAQYTVLMTNFHFKHISLNADQRILKKTIILFQNYLDDLS